MNNLNNLSKEIEKRRRAVCTIDKLRDLANQGKLAEKIVLKKLYEFKLAPHHKPSREGYDILLERKTKNRIQVKGAKFHSEDGGYWTFSLGRMLDIKKRGFDYLVFAAFNKRYDVDKFFILTLGEIVKKLKFEQELPKNPGAIYQDTNPYLLTIYKNNKNKNVCELSEPEKKINKNIENYENRWDKIIKQKEYR